MAKRPGWYYTPEGRLRYHDENGWTQHYLTFEEIRNHDGPPPPPMSMLDQVLERQIEAASSEPQGKSRWPWKRRWVLERVSRRPENHQR